MATIPKNSSANLTLEARLLKSAAEEEVGAGDTHGNIISRCQGQLFSAKTQIHCVNETLNMILAELSFSKNFVGAERVLVNAEQTLTALLGPLSRSLNDLRNRSLNGLVANIRNFNDSSASIGGAVITERATNLSRLCSEELHRVINTRDLETLTVEVRRAESSSVNWDAAAAPETAATGLTEDDERDEDDPDRDDLDRDDPDFTGDDN